MFQQIVLVDLAFMLAFKGVGPEFLATQDKVGRFFCVTPEYGVSPRDFLYGIVYAPMYMLASIKQI